ncbi:hypothetical protein [Gloeobacter kilaueensis]|uniref:Uncharacterized protein n=1 Tax=Gloeobacter kilaueensis (strain ATCC BAA-2537 / CCAP 1431/1 / ULC 316 / JS1) TaxID=1183438 RepID=U5QPG4_GLOK1|nr:hypothetical protein [Gloeobacter kilaueensis]AGY59575.1 hypothetical protein GKIL_3329 [Gloeobacter kilaueensis JS1]
MRTFFRALLIVIVLATAASAAAPLINTDPTPAQALHNPIDIKISLKLSGEAGKSLDWRHPRVVVNGYDATEMLRPLLEGANAVPIKGDQFVIMDSTVQDDQAEFHIYGFDAPLGPHQVLVEVPRSDGSPPLRYQAQYVVTALPPR